MDAHERAALRATLGTWAKRNAARLLSMEEGTWPALRWAGLFAELDELGVLLLLYEPDTRHALAIVAEVAHCLAPHSPSLAQLVVQQNLAAHLLAEAGAPRPAGWVALPLYEAAVEWPHQLAVAPRADGFTLNGAWTSLPALPIASALLLPLASGEAQELSLVALTLAEPGVAVSDSVKMLGLRGCPVADLVCAEASIHGAAVLMRGADVRRRVEALWSQAEALLMALRAGLLARSYAVARDYAATRWQGQKLIQEHSLVQRMLAELFAASASAGESWRAMVDTLAPGRPLRAGQLGLSARLASDLPRLTSDGIQLLGGYGYMEDFAQERLFRDAKQCEMLLGHPQAKRLALWHGEDRRGVGGDAATSVAS